MQDATRPGERTKLEVSSLVETVMDEAAETGADAAVEHAERAVVDGDPIALKRLVTNLVDNALKFGSSARAAGYSPRPAWRSSRWTTTGRACRRATSSAPSSRSMRLESSRSRETGGAGLGLAVVRAIARGHGGEVTLQNRAEGGLRARVDAAAGDAHARRVSRRRQALTSGRARRTFVPPAADGAERLQQPPLQQSRASGVVRWRRWDCRFFRRNRNASQL